jgi:two-component system, cell cycle response regulator
VRRVLVVDDSRVVREALESALEPYGFEVQQAENGAVALQKLKRSPFDLALVDIHMPILDGPSLIRLMRAQGITAKVILITSGAATPVITSAVKLGVSDYVSKPFKPERIRVVVARVLGLDAGDLQVRHARVLVQYPEQALAARLRELLPPHVEVDACGPVFARALELAEKQAYAVVLLDAGALGGERGTAAALVRELVPFAAIFAVGGGARQAALWAPDGALDGTLPGAVDEELARGFLYPNFLRPLVFEDGAVYHAAGFQGDERHLPAYFHSLGRAIAGRCSREVALQDLLIDLTRVPPDAGALAAVIRLVHERLDATGAAPAFRVSEAVACALAERPELRRTVIFS